MNFRISKNIFYNAIQSVSRAITPNSPVPALCGIYINAAEDSLVLTGSDADISIEITLSNANNEKTNLSVIETGSIVIDARYLNDIVRKMDSDEIQIEIIDGTLTRFSGGNAEFKINGYRPGDYPSVDFSVPEIRFSIKASDFVNIIEVTAFAASNKETRPVLTGVNLHSDGSNLIATATDSYRLAKKTFPISTSEFNITVPAKCLNEVKSIYGSSEDEIEIALSTKKIQFRSSSTIMQSRLLDGGYPETERLIPKEFGYTMVINRRALISAIDRTSFIKTDNMSIIRLQINNKDDIAVMNKSQEIGESREELFASSYEGEPLDISFSGNYVMDAAKALSSDEIMIRFTGEMKPFVLTDAGENSTVLQLVLPVRTYN